MTAGDNYLQTLLSPLTCVIDNKYMTGDKNDRDFSELFIGVYAITGLVYILPDTTF